MFVGVGSVLLVYRRCTENRSPVWGTNYIEFEWFAPKAGLQ